MPIGLVDINDASRVLSAFSGTAANYDFILIDNNEATESDRPKTVALTLLDARYTLAGVDNSTPVTLAGSYDYLTLSGQQITLAQIDLTTDVTGALPIANGGSGQATASAALAAFGGVPLAGGTMTGLLQFSGTTHAGLQLLSLTTTERDALTPAAGQLIYNETDAQFQGYTSSWGQIGGGGSSLPVDDDTAIVYQTGDVTRTFTIAADNLTAARVGTLPNSDFTFAGLEVAQTFTAAQTISFASVGTAQVLKATNTTYGVTGVLGVGSVGWTFGAPASTSQMILYSTAPSSALVITSSVIQIGANMSIIGNGASTDLTLRSNSSGSVNRSVLIQGFSSSWQTVFAAPNKAAGNTIDAYLVTNGGLVSVGASSPSAKVHIDQSSATGAVPVLLLDQADVDQVAIKFVGTSDSGAVDRTLVSAGDFTTPGSIAAWIQITLQDDRVGGITAGDYYLPVYSAPSA